MSNAYVMSHDAAVMDGDGNNEGISTSVMKITINGNQVASNRYYDIYYDVHMESINTDSVGNIYMVGKRFDPNTIAPSTADNRGIIIKTTPSGTIIWQKELTQLFYPENQTFANFIAIDSSDNLYVNVTGWISTGRIRTIIKFNSAGTVQWQKQLPFYINPVAGTVDSSGNLYLIAYNTTSVVDTLIKLNSSGVVQWAKEFGSDYPFVSITADSYGNIYLGGTGLDPYTSYTDAPFFKYDSTGTLIWGKSLVTYNPYTGTVKSMIIRDDKIDFTGDLYNGNDGFSYHFGMTGQLNLDGDFVWMNNFYDTNFESGVYPVQGLRTVTKSSNGLIFAGTATDLDNLPITLFGRVPSDGNMPYGVYVFPSGNEIFYTSNAAYTTSLTPTESSITISTSTGSVTVQSASISLGTTSITTEKA
jgi:hypothetical protein